MCTGFTGADLQNLMNEAAILAARRELKEISKEEISDALEKIIAGPEKKGAVVSEAKKKLVAYHEVCLLAPYVVSFPLRSILLRRWGVHCSKLATVAHRQNCIHIFIQHQFLFPSSLLWSARRSLQGVARGFTK